MSVNSFEIGNVRIKRPIILAPMEHVTNSIFRRIVKPFGAGLMFTEFCSSDGLIYGKDKLWNMVRFHDSERPMTIQIFGGNPDVMAECAKRMEDLGADILDINCGCSVPKMQKCNAGAYLARDLSLLKTVMEKVKKAVRIPVTIKVRKGWDEEHVTCLEVARMAELIGFSAITVHGRTSVQAYSGKADWRIIDEVSRSVSIPVIGSGDIASVRDARDKLEKTGVSGVMIGRGVMGKPWVFLDSEVGHGPRERLDVILHHLRLCFEEMGPVEGVREMRRHLAWYVRGLPGAASFRGWLQTASFQGEIEKRLEALFGESLSLSA